MRALIFRYKKDFAPRLPGTTGNGAGSKGNGQIRYPVFEDLTRLNFFKLRSIAKNENVHSCWSVSGSLRFRLKNDEIVRKVKNIYDPVEKIISSL